MSEDTADTSSTPTPPAPAESALPANPSRALSDADKKALSALREGDTIVAKDGTRARVVRRTEQSPGSVVFTVERKGGQTVDISLVDLESIVSEFGLASVEHPQSVAAGAGGAGSPSQPVQSSPESRQGAVVTQRDFPFELLSVGSIVNFANGREAQISGRQSSSDGKVIFSLRYKDDPAEQYMTLDDFITKADSIVSVTEGEVSEPPAPAASPEAPPQE